MTLAVRLVISMVAITLVLALVNWLVLRRVAAAFRLGRRGQRAAALVLGAPLLATVLFRGIGTRAPIGFAEPIVIATSAFEAAVGLTGVALLVLASARAVYRAGARLGRRAGAAMGDEARDDPTAGADDRSTESDPRANDSRANEHRANDSRANEHRASDDEGAGDRGGSEALAVTRRAFVEQAIVGSAMVAGATASTYGAVFGRHDYELSTVPVPVRGLSRAADGFTIVQLSDIHLGQMVGEAEMRAAEELVRRAKGDLIVLTGDLIDHDPRYVERLGRLVRRLGEIKPVVAIPGNHDYYTGVDAVLDATRAAGATVLVNESIVLLGDEGGIVLAGLDDHRGELVGRGPDLRKALAGVRSDGPRIVLCHNPKEFLEIAGDVALQISGHTHGGQINVGLPVAEMVLRHRYIAGLYEDRGSHLYVNRGFGTAGAAVRVGSPPEVTRIVLVAS